MSGTAPNLIAIRAYAYAVRVAYTDDSAALGDAIGYAVNRAIDDAHTDAAPDRFTDSCAVCDALADSYPIADTAPDSAAERY